MKINSYKPVHPRPQQDVDTQLRDASRLYERQFLAEMVKAMRQTVSHTNEPSMAEKIYSDQMYDQYLDKWAEQGGVGLADIIYGQLRERFYPEKQQLPRPQGPVPVDKGTSIKIDETKSMGLPVIQNGRAEEKDLSYLFEFDATSRGPKPVLSPWDGEVIQVIRQDDRHLLKLAHKEGTVSTLSFVGTAADLKRGDAITAGQKLGMLSPDASGLTWQVSLLET